MKELIKCKINCAEHKYYIKLNLSIQLFIEEEHTSPEAAEHMAWKYRRVRNLIRSSRDFIKHIASRSSTTGKLYFIKLRDGRSYPAGEVLTNELEVLEKTLVDQPKIQETTTASEQPSVS
ncbi:MAG: DUF5329 family protein [Candidatus Omnitrophica bacterium]|nr:DUF5329 family protein [Candidatus Omnitrophota bacterium]